MNSTVLFDAALNSNGFTALTLGNNGLTLVDKNNEETSILFSEIEKIYIKKNKFTFFDKLLFLSFFSTLLLMILFWWPIEAACIFFFASIPLAVKVYTYKWYGLYLVHNQDLICLKRFYQNNKQAYINLVSGVRKEMYSHQIMFPSHRKFKTNTDSNDYNLRSLHIA